MNKSGPAPQNRSLTQRLKELPLIWRFMTIPVLAGLMQVMLGVVFWDLRQTSITELETMRSYTHNRLEAVVDLGHELAETYSNIYEVLLDAPNLDSEAELYSRSRPHLNKLHAIEEALARELTLVATDPAVKAEVDTLVETLEKARIIVTNALLISTVDFGFASKQIYEINTQFVLANRQLLIVEHLLHDDLNSRIDSLVSDLKVKTREIGALSGFAFIIVIAYSILMISSIMRDGRKAVLSVSQITSSNIGKTDTLGVGNEILLLNRSIEDARQSHEQLKETSKSLEDSLVTLKKRELDLSASNSTLSEKLEELERVIHQRDVAENALSKAQRMEAIGNLTGGVAHDFNNLLAIILGNLELLKVEQKDTEKDKMIDAAVDATLRGADLTKNMLAFARRARLQPKVLDINDIIRRTKNWAGRTLPATIEIESSLLAGLWRTKADESSVESALLNLVLNARDAMPDGGKLTIETANIRVDDEYVDDRAEEIEPGRYVMLAVSDTGTGIAPEILERIFDPFFTTKAPGDGSGLGLSMIEGFTRQSGGSVRVYSEIGVGTTFKLYFKALSSDYARQEDPEVQNVQSTPDSVKVLVVEDEPRLLEVIVATLGNAGYQVRFASSGDDALEKFTANPSIDVLVTDIVMPGRLQGTTLAKELRVQNPGLPVVFMSGYASEATVHGNGLRPEDIRLMKPIRSSDLLRAIEKVRSNSDKRR